MKLLNCIIKIVYFVYLVVIDGTLISTYNSIISSFKKVFN